MKYDAIIIGAGMSGLAAGIRLGMFDKKVLVLEKHSIPGGLNSYYQRKNFDQGGIRQFDVGLHALTNFIKKGEKGKPFSKLLKQLRLSYDEFNLCPQTYSKITFPSCELKFSNDFELLKSEVFEKFPHEIDNFNKLVERIVSFNELDLNQAHLSSREILKSLIHDELLIEMLLCPPLIYGSAWENDMDFSQFVVMFKSLYFEGFSRPKGGVRTILALLMNKLKNVGGEVLFKTSVSQILVNERGEAHGVVANGREIYAPVIFSSIGYPETVKMTPTIFPTGFHPRVGSMTFLESIFIFNKKIPLHQNDSTIIFYNNDKKYRYEPPVDYFDITSAVICFPDNYEPLNTEGEGVVRLTSMANYEKWRNLSRSDYEEMKEKVSQSALSMV